jgi:hypothetical protein
MDAEDFVTVPVAATFGGEPIGELRIRKSALPENPSYVFALAYRSIGHSFDGPFELCEVAIQTDAQYLRYLQKMKGE